MWRLSIFVIASGLAPRGYDKPEKVLIAIQWGAEIGLSPMQSLKSIAVIGNNPAVWGDAIPALCRRHPQFKSIKEEWVGEGEKRKCRVTMRRKDDEEPTVREFGYADAKRAGLVGKDTYLKFADRMYQCRARAWAAHDCFPDALMGLAIAEEVLDCEFTEQGPSLSSGDDAPLNTLDEAADLLDADADKVDALHDSPSSPTPEELADAEYQQQPMF